jgi:methyl-accepting chemotaxis protein WspA
MKSLTIGRKVIFSFGAILLAMAVIGVLGFIQLNEVEAEANAVEHDTLPGLYHTGLIKDALNEDRRLRLRQRTADHTNAGDLIRAIQENNDQMDQLLAGYEATITADVDRSAFADFKAALARYHAAVAPHSPGELRADELGDRAARADSEFPKIMAQAEALSLKNKEWGVQRAMHVRKSIDDLQLTFLIAFLVALALVLACSVHLVRSINRPLAHLLELMEVMRNGDFTQRMTIARHDEFGHLGDGFNRMADEVMGLVSQVQKSGIRINTSMTEIAATAKQQQATANEVAASTTQIGATSREISATSKELSRTMNEVASVAEHAAGLAGSGQTGLLHMEESMGQVMEAAGTINTKLSTLNEKASNINQVVTTITKVADQTNLLSLNAAIEAEKAGEYGRGFAVVSSEIRRLADQTAVATLDIEEMVKEIQSAVSAGVMGMDKFSEQVRRGMQDVQQIGAKLSEVIDQVQTLAPRFEAVNDGMEAQAVGAEQISEALLQLTETTRQTVEALHQSNSAIDELSQVSAGLHDSVSRFKLAS